MQYFYLDFKLLTLIFSLFIKISSWNSYKLVLIPPKESLGSGQKSCGVATLLETRQDTYQRYKRNKL